MDSCEWPQRLLVGDGARRLDETACSTRGVEVIAGPDHPYGRRGGVAVRGDRS